GTGQTIAPHLGFSALANNLGGARLGQTATTDSALTITNQGAAPLIVSSIRLADSGGPFTLSGVPADLATNPLTLQYGQTFTFGASFAPDKLGLTRAMVRIATNDPAQSLAKVSLVGTGIDS